VTLGQITIPYHLGVAWGLQWAQCATYVRLWKEVSNCEYSTLYCNLLKFHLIAPVFWEEKQAQALVLITMQWLRLQRRHSLRETQRALIDVTGQYNDVMLPTVHCHVVNYPVHKWHTKPNWIQLIYFPFIGQHLYGLTSMEQYLKCVSAEGWRRV